MPQLKEPKPLPQDKASAETLKDSLVDLKDNQAYLLVMDRLDSLLSQAQRLLVQAETWQDASRFQGQVKAYEEAMGMVKTLLSEIENTQYKE